MLGMMLSARDSSANLHYSAQSTDKRALRAGYLADGGAVNVFAEQMSDLAHNGNAEDIVNALREAKCAENLMVFSHHLTDEQRAEISTATALPTMKEGSVVCVCARVPPARARIRGKPFSATRAHGART